MNSITHSYNQGQHVVVLNNMGLDSMLLGHWIKICPDLASTRFRIHSVFKSFHSGERIKKRWIRLPDSSDTCGRSSNPQRKGGEIQ